MPVPTQFQPQHIRARKLVMSDKVQTTYGTALLLASYTRQVRMDAAAYMAIVKEFYTDLERTGKGHPWATVHDVVAQNTSFQMTVELTDVLAGLLLALVFGQDTPSGAGAPYTHLFTFLQSSNLAPVTSLYFEDTADIKRQLLDMGVTEIKISGSDRGPLMAQVSFLGSGRYTDGSLAVTATLDATPAYLFAQNTSILLGAPGAAADISSRVRSWEATFSSGLSLHRAPGSGLFGVQHKIDKQMTGLSLVVSAKDTDDIDTLRANDTLQEVQINTNSGASCQLNIKWPNVRFGEAIPLGNDGNEEVWKLDASDAQIQKGAGLNLVEATVINAVASYLVAG